MMRKVIDKKSSIVTVYKSKFVTSDQLPVRRLLKDMLWIVILMVCTSIASAQILNGNGQSVTLVNLTIDDDNSWVETNGTDSNVELRSGFSLESVALEVANKTFYFFTYARVSWYDAYRQCRIRGLRLATIDNYEQDRDVVEFINKKSWSDNRFWVAATDLGAANLEYYWLTNGRDMRKGYVNWSPGEPNNGELSNTEHCIEINFRGQWNDYVCTEPTNLFICEKVACKDN